MPSRTFPSARAALVGIDIFATMPDTTICALAEITNLRHYRKDMFVFTEGDAAELFCFVHKGAVKVFKTTADGTEQTLHLLRTGDFFAVTGFVVPGEYPGTAQTMEDSWIGCIRNVALHALARRDVELAWSLLVLFGRRLTGTSRQVLDLATRDAAGKLAAALLQLAQVESGRPPDPVTIDMHLTHRELAQLIGASRETVSRLMSDFRADGAVEPLGSGRLTLFLDVLQRYVP